MVPCGVLAAALSLSATALASETLEGEVEAGGGDYVELELEVPAGTAEVEIRHETLSSGSILDWGVWGPEGFRGWSGGLEDPIRIGEEAASRGYLPGPIEAGTWRLVIGKAELDDPPVGYRVEVEYREEATLEPRPREPYEATTLATDARWYRGDFHVHSQESGDAAASLAEIASLARDRGLDFVVVTDHNTVSHVGRIAALQKEVDDVLLIPGIEVTTYAGHGGAIGVDAYIDHRVGHEGRTIGGAIADVRDRGGLFAVNHPALALGDLCIGCAWAYDDTPWEEVSALEIHTGSYEFAGLFAGPAIDLWEEALDGGHPVAAIGGSDDHRAGIDLDETQAPIGSPTTLVWAEALSESAILEGVSDGRTIVNLRGPDDPELSLEVEGGGSRAGIGDRIRAAEISARATASGAEGYRLALYRNGSRVESLPIEDAEHEQVWSFETSAEGNDRYRAEIREGSVPLVVTSHVFVDAGAAERGGCSSSRHGGGLALAFAAGAALAWRRRRAAGRFRRRAAPY